MTKKDYRYKNKTVKCVVCGETFRPRHSKPDGKYCSHPCATQIVNRKWQIDFSFFQSWTWQLAYWIGLMITDGCVATRNARKGKPYRVIFANTDKELVEFVGACVSPGQKIRTQHSGRYKTQYWWVASSARLAKQVCELGIIPRKSLIAKLPKVPTEFQWDLLRGILDGDGTIDKTGIIIYYSASIHFIDELSELLRREGFQFHVTIEPPRQNQKTFYSLRLYKADSSRLAHLLYSSNHFCLKRKREQALIQYNLPLI